jgi:transcription elongation factor Elf1
MNEEKLRIGIYPAAGGHERRFICPECESHLPFNSYTECDNCGAHLELYVKTVAPSITNE